MAMGVGGGRRRRRAPMAEINVTPMVDVMLVLLIIFMVAAPLLVTGVPVDLPRTGAAALNADTTPISVTVDRTGRVFVGDDPLPPGALATRMRALRVARAEDTRVFLRADATVPYGAVASALADVTGAGFTKVALVNQPGGAQPGGDRSAG